MATKSRLVYTAAVLGGLWSAPALGQEGPRPDLRAVVDTDGPRLLLSPSYHRLCIHSCGQHGVPVLAVINGVPYLKVPTEFRREDIESITFVKPPESVERYGERARHGAVLIRTSQPLPPPDRD